MAVLKRYYAAGKPPPPIPYPTPEQIAQRCLAECRGNLQCAAGRAIRYARGGTLRAALSRIGTAGLRASATNKVTARVARGRYVAARRSLRSKEVS